MFSRKLILIKLVACSSLSCFAEAVLTKGFLVQDDHEGDQADKIYRPEASQALVPKQFVKAHCAPQALFL